MMYEVTGSSGQLDDVDVRLPERVSDLITDGFITLVGFLSVRSGPDRWLDLARTY